jgi:hypothetical protein
MGFPVAPRSLPLLILALVAASAPLQAGEDPPGLNNPAYVAVDVDAEKDLLLAEQLLRTGRSLEAVRLLVDIRRRFGDQLHRAHVDPEGRFERYVRVDDFVRDRLLHLPPDARTRYLDWAEPQARRAFDDLPVPPTPELLTAFLDKHDATPTGARARRLLGDRWFEQGRDYAALKAWRPLLERPGAPDPPLVRRLVAVLHRLGRAAERRALLERFDPEAPWAGSLADPAPPARETTAAWTCGASR